jgi:hypothetical protein
MSKHYLTLPVPNIQHLTLPVPDPACPQRALLATSSWLSNWVRGEMIRIQDDGKRVVLELTSLTFARRRLANTPTISGKVVAGRLGVGVSRFLSVKAVQTSLARLGQRTP